MESSLLKDHEVGGFYIIKPLGDAVVFLSPDSRAFLAASTWIPAWGLCILLLSDASYTHSLWKKGLETAFKSWSHSGLHIKGVSVIIGDFFVPVS